MSKSTFPDSVTRLVRPSMALMGLLVASGCAITPEPLTRDEFRQIVQNDRSATQANMDPVTSAISLQEAIARALKYNLEHRSRLWEQALAAGQLDASRFDMLPKMMANIGYYDRSVDSATWSPDAAGKPTTTRAPVSADKTHTTNDIGLSWSVLDFGLSYYGAQQNADRVLIASERRRKAVHTLIQNVRTAFWRAASADKLAQEVRATITQAEAALADSRKLETDRVKAPGDALRYQRALLENLRTLESIERELAAARVELANLINLPPGTPFTLVEPSGSLAQPGPIGLAVERMEEMALERNADLKEHAYNARIAAVETRKAMLRLFPNLSLSTTLKSDSNSFLVNQHWNESAVQVSWNLLNLLSGPSQMDVAETAVKVAESKRATMQMGVLMQVHLAARQYDTSLRLFERAHAIWDVDNRLMDLAQAGEQAKMQSQQALISTRTTTILSLLRRYQALASVHESASKLHATLGLEPEIGSLDDISLPDLTGQIEKTLSGAVGQVAAEAPAALAPQVSSEVAPQAAPVAAAVASSDQLRSDSLPVPRAPTSATVPVTPARAGDWIVVLGAHRNSGHAMDIARHTRALGLPVFIEDATDGQQKRTKVRAGPFADKDAAEAALLQLTQKGHAGQVRRY